MIRNSSPRPQLEACCRSMRYAQIAIFPPVCRSAGGIRSCGQSRQRPASRSCSVSPRRPHRYGRRSESTASGAWCPTSRSAIYRWSAVAKAPLRYARSCASTISATLRKRAMRSTRCSGYRRRPERRVFPAAPVPSAGGSTSHWNSTRQPGRAAAFICWRPCSIGFLPCTRRSIPLFGPARYCAGGPAARPPGRPGPARGFCY